MGRYHKPGLWRSLNQAWRGLIHTWKTQGHIKFHFVAGISVLCCAWLWGVTNFEWLILIVAIGCVIAAEVMNTAIEIVVDMVQPNFHPLAGMAKDVASGVVLVTAIQAITIGMIVFFPRLFRLASKIF
ncbi:MAG TPA: diacylglycerol kinase family protein [Desulfosporosinus sp.]|nr:diacylglycerol kinase family protein [Desulfosporosinus sp.]